MFQHFGPRPGSTRGLYCESINQRRAGSLCESHKASRRIQCGLGQLRCVSRNVRPISFLLLRLASHARLLYRSSRANGDISMLSYTKRLTTVTADCFCWTLPCGAAAAAAVFCRARTFLLMLLLLVQDIRFCSYPRSFGSTDTLVTTIAPGNRPCRSFRSAG